MDERSGETYFVCDSCGELEEEDHRDDCELMAFLRNKYACSASTEEKASV